MPSARPISISVIIPAYNAEKYLADAIRSVQNQGYPDLEILVVDDGSTDRSLEVARSYSEIRGYSQANAGPAAARNLGLREARGELIAFLDADDWWPTGRLQSLLTPIMDNPQLDIVSGRMHWVGPEVFKRDGSPDFLGEPFVTLTFPCSLIRRSAFERVGPINPEFRRGEDTEWFLRARESHLNIHVLEEVVLYYRRHGRNLTRDASPVAGLTLQILKASLDRRRRENSGEVRSFAPLEMDPDLAKKP